MRKLPGRAFAHEYIREYGPFRPRDVGQDGDGFEVVLNDSSRDLIKIASRTVAAESQKLFDSGLGPYPLEICLNNESVR